jgi:signal transduction histidine kinase
MIMTTTRIKWILIIMPALIIGLFELIRHTALMLSVLPMDVGNWLTPLIDAVVIAIVSRTLVHRLIGVEQALSHEKATRATLEERESIARALHDQIAQSIFYSGVQLNATREIAKIYDDSALMDNLDQVLMSLREMDESIRNSIFSLRTQITVDQNFESKIRSYLEKILTVNQIEWTFHFSTNASELSAKKQVQLFGILQETLANIVKHSRATKVSVTLDWDKQIKDNWTFIVEDNGIGFDIQSISQQQHGLNIITSRAYEIGASIAFDSNSHGTKVVVVGQGV